MVLAIILIFTGFAILILGAHWLVDGSSSLARKYGVSDLTIGLTIVAFGTSAPELMVNSLASLMGYSDIVMGNVIGSNNFNLFIILGLAGMVYPIKVQSSTVWREIPLSIIATLLFIILANGLILASTGGISRLDAIVLFVGFTSFLYYVYTQLDNEGVKDSTKSHKSNWIIWGGIVFGLAGLVGGGQLVVHYSVEMAKIFGISEKVIAMTIVAAGTSLPELVTSLVASLKKNSDIAIGNIIGSNIFNILLIIPVSAMFRPIEYSVQFNRDIAILIGGTLFLFLAMFTGGKRKLDRWEAMLLFIFYVIYTIYLIRNG